MAIRWANGWPGRLWRLDRPPPPSLPPPPPERPAPAGPAAPLREPLWRLGLHRLIGLLRPRYRDRTPHEVALEGEVERLRHDLWERDNTLWRLRTELAEKAAEVASLEREITHWVAVHERDRLRVEADRAMYSAQIALATPRGAGPPGQEQLGE